MISSIQFRNATTQEWMDPGVRSPDNEDAVRLNGAGPSGVVTVLFSEAGWPPWNQARLANLVELLQYRCDTRYDLSYLVSMDDPRGTTNPDTEREFWDGDEIVFRAIVIEDPEVDEGLVKISIKRANRN